MMTLADHALLQQYAADQSEAAFAALVDRHLPLVHSAALRRAHGDAHLAAEIAQGVFLILARKAGDIRPKTVLTGWLYRTTQYVAADAMRQKLRRQHREQQAYLESTLTGTDIVPAPDETEAVWHQLVPVLDAALQALRPADRDAVLLRYFENQPLAAVGAALGVSEDAARVRVNRALDKLRDRLAQQGVVLGGTAIAGAMSAHAVTAAPAALATTISAAAMTGTTFALTTFTMTTIQKIAVTAALTVTLGAGAYAMKEAHTAKAEAQRLRAQQAPLTDQLRELQAERDQASNQIVGLKETLAATGKNNLELMKLRGEVALWRQRAKLATFPRSADNPPAHDTAPAAGQPTDDSPAAQFDAQEQNVLRALQVIAKGIEVFADDYGGAPATNTVQLIPYLVRTNFAGNVKLNDFEFLTPGTAGKLVLRERQPRISPAGLWYRGYATADGKALEMTETNEAAFADFEQSQRP